MFKNLYWKLKRMLYLLIMMALTDVPTIVAIMVAGFTPTTLYAQQLASDVVAETKLCDASPPPAGIIDFFKSRGTSERDKEYNSLKTKEERDQLIKKRLKEDWTNTITPDLSSDPTKRWDCDQYSLQLKINSTNFGENVTYSSRPMYNNYKGNNLDTIHMNQGTLKDMGKLGLPMYSISISASPIFHSMNTICTGNDPTKWESWNFIEPQTDSTNVQPGAWDMPKNIKDLTIYTNYLYKTPCFEKTFTNFAILTFEVKDGVPKLTYNINEDTSTYTDPMNNYTRIPLNQRMQLKTIRDFPDGIEDKLESTNTIKTYPNPFNDYLNVTSQNQKDIETIKVYNVAGQEIININQKNSHETNYKLDTQKLSSGMYIIDVNGQKQKIIKGK